MTNVSDYYSRVNSIDRYTLRNENEDIHDITRAIDEYAKSWKNVPNLTPTDIYGEWRYDGGENDRKALMWLFGNTTGVSSMCLCAAYFGVKPTEVGVPRDNADFKRCQDFLDLFDKSTQERILERVTAFSPLWEKFVKRWSVLEGLYRLRDKHTLFTAISEILYPNH